MRRVILESPYGSDDDATVQRNVDYARKCMHDSLLLGEAPIASHLLYTQPGVLLDRDPLQRAIGIAAGHAWMPFADAVVFYIDHGMSDGMKIAQEFAQRLRMPIEVRRLYDEEKT